MSSVALRARSLEKRFGAVVALRGLDLEVERGAVHAILGPNGAGKSTLLRILAGLSHPSRGEVRIISPDGIESDPRKARRALGYVGHASLIYPELSARENLLFTGRLYGVPNRDQRARQLLREEGLEGAADRRAGDFSRGMAQRLSIARALVHDPELILLDEPFTGLDRRSARRLTTRLSALRDEGRTLVLITHDLDQAGELADTAQVMIRGNFVRSLAGDELESHSLEAAYVEALEQAERPNSSSRHGAAS